MSEVRSQTPPMARWMSGPCLQVGLPWLALCGCEAQPPVAGVLLLIRGAVVLRRWWRLRLGASRGHGFRFKVGAERDF